MARIAWVCLFGAATLGLCKCSAQNQARVGNPSQSTNDTADYSLSQQSASQPDRANCRQPGDCTVPAVLPPTKVLATCDSETCEGELTQAAIAELRQAATGLQDCYEKELRRFEREKLDHQKLEGRVLLQIRIAADQALCSARVERSDFELSEGFTACVTGKLKNTTARPTSGCVDIALPLAFVKKEVDKLPDEAGASPPSGSK